MGLFITFEGVEGCGKTTQIGMLADRLMADGYRVQLTREPGGCMISDKIRSILLDAENCAMISLTELLLYAAARAQHVSEVIKPALAEGAIVLCDRFTDATVAYQHFGRQIERTTIDSLNTLACQSLRPDLTVLMDCDAAMGLARAKNRIATCSGPKEERFELEQLTFHQRVRDGYLQQAAHDPKRFITVNADGSIDDIAAIILTKIMKKLEDSPRAVR